MWDWSYAFGILPELVRAMGVTVQATLWGFVLAMSVGLVLALLRRSRFRLLNGAAGAAIEFIRSTPLLVQAFFLFYVLPFYGITIPPFMTGVLALGLHYAAYLSEVYRSGIESVPKGQWEAAVALNLSKTQTWTRIVLPQALPPIIPVLGNYFIVMFKETPILSAITVVEMLQRAKILGSESFRYTEGFTLVGLLFLLLSGISSFLINRLELAMKRKQGGNSLAGNTSGRSGRAAEKLPG